MLAVLDLVTQVAPSRSTVLLSGESGTGKEVIAKAIHSASTRSDKAFIPINTGSIPVDLLESQLFGHVKGAFTSAIASKKAVSSKSPTKARFSLTKSPPSARKRKPSFCVLSKSASSCASAAPKPSKSTSASSLLPTKT